MSDQSKNSLPKNFDLCYPPYCHWFAVKLYDVYVRAKELLQDSAQPSISLELDGNTFAIDRSHLDFAVDSLYSACNLSASNCARGIGSSEGMCTAENTFTSLYARIMDRFLFMDPRVGGCLHQGSSRVRKEENDSTLEKADVYILTFNHDMSPGPPFAVADIKIEEFDKAVRESVLYGVSCSEQSGPKRWPVLLGLPGTKGETELFVFVPFSCERFFRYSVVKSQTYDRALLCTLYVAVNYLCKNPIVYESPPKCPMPVKDGCYQQLGETFESGVFLDAEHNMVVKLYDKRGDESCFHPNEELLNLLGLTFELTNLSQDGRLRILKYPYIPGDHTPDNVQHFKGAVESLEKIHKNGYIHGDIRIENVIFMEDSNSCLIDFDLARRDDDDNPCYYPKNYNDISVRHPETSGNSRMLKEHDIYQRLR